MSILKYKYKAHKFINYAFYVAIFIVGFLLGFGAEKIEFNKLVSQVLMIDSVQAYTIETQNNVEFNEEFIYNAFQKWSRNSYTIDDFKFEDNGLVSCYVRSSRYTWHCDMLITNEIQNYSSSNWSFGSGSSASPYHFISFDYNYSTSSYSYSGTSSGVTSNTSGITKRVTNFNSIENFNSLYTMDYSSYNKLDFSKYTVKLEYNVNLFKDNPDFKEVCVDGNSIIAITRTDNPENLEYMTDYDYIWFPYGVSGLKSYNYHNADLLNKDNTDILEELDWSSDNIFQYDNYSPFFFKDKETIDEIYNDEIKGGNLKFKGYTDKNSYYGWTSALFNLWFDYRDGNNFNFFPIFEFENLTKLYINDSSGTIHGGGGNRLDGDNEIELSTQYCFYIKKEYSVTKVYKNEFNDISGNVPTQNGDFNFATSQNKNNNNSGNFLSQPKNFINSMKDTINFINSLIYEFYISLPLLLRTFIITLLIILIIMLIMKIGGYN